MKKMPGKVLLTLCKEHPLFAKLMRTSLITYDAGAIEGPALEDVEVLGLRDRFINYALVDDT